MRSNDRPSWDSYFLQIARIVATRATCTMGFVQRGCIIVRDKRVVSAGYEGSPPGELHCSDVGHLITITNMEDTESVAPLPPGEVNCARAVHAEMNAIFQAAKFGIPIDGCELHLTHTPCDACVRAFSSVNLSRIVVGGSTYSAKIVNYRTKEG